MKKLSFQETNVSQFMKFDSPIFLFSVDVTQLLNNFTHVEETELDYNIISPISPSLLYEDTEVMVEQQFHHQHLTQIIIGADPQYAIGYMNIEYIQIFCSNILSYNLRCKYSRTFIVNNSI